MFNMLLPESRDFCSPSICFQCQQTFAHPVYAPKLMRNVSYCDYTLYGPEAITYGEEH